MTHNIPGIREWDELFAEATWHDASNGQWLEVRQSFFDKLRRLDERCG